MQPASEDRHGGNSWRNTAASNLFPQDVSSRTRISHACDRCRAMRGRCSGGLRCERCAGDDVTCFYGDRKREHNKRITAKANRIEDLESVQALLVDALKGLRSNAELMPDQRAYVDSLLQKVSKDATTEGIPAEFPFQTTTESLPTSNGHGRRIKTLFNGAERNTASKVESPGLDVDINPRIHLEDGSGMVGFVGKMSETSWMRRISIYLDNPPSKLDVAQDTTDHASPTPGTTSTLTYFMDEEDLLSINEDDVNHFQKPPRTTSLLLTEAFFHSLQGAFPFVSYHHFHDMLSTVMSEGFPSSWDDVRQLALCNMIWASGARWLQKSQLWHGTSVEDHLIYYARARALGCDHRIQFEHPDVLMLQSIAIMAFYLLLNGSVQRAWNILGQAIRHAISLGLHLSTIPEVRGNEEQRTKRNLWFALYRMETFVGEILGRPTCIQNSVIMESPLPPAIQAVDTLSNDINDFGHGESRAAWMQFLAQNRRKPDAFDAFPWSSGHLQTAFLDIPASYFPAALRLNRISTEIATKIFSNTLHKTWFQVQCSIAEVEATLQAWSRDLPQELHVENIERNKVDRRLNLELAMNLCSVEMILYRPCLCNIDIKDESVDSREFNVLRARSCVLAAVRVIDLMPVNPAAAQVFQNLPGWSTLHYICQAGSVLLLEMCLGMQYLSEAEQVTAAFRKVLEFLTVLSPHLKSAYRAFQILRALADKVSRQLHTGALVLTVGEPVFPPRWSDVDDAETMAMLNALRFREPG